MPYPNLSRTLHRNQQNFLKKVDQSPDAVFIGKMETGQMQKSHHNLPTINPAMQVVTFRTKLPSRSLMAL